MDWLLPLKEMAHLHPDLWSTVSCSYFGVSYFAFNLIHLSVASAASAASAASVFGGRSGPSNERLDNFNQWMSQYILLYGQIMERLLYMTTYHW